MQKNTLFSYFSKSPAAARKASSPITADDAGDRKSKSPKETAKGPGSNGGQDARFKVGDIVWAKLEGYPWWPSLVCDHPSLGTHLKGGKKAQVHVQFFDEPPSRSWIAEKFVEAFNVKDFERGGKFYTQKPDVCKSVEKAKKALELATEERLNLVVCIKSEDEEEEEEMEDNEMTASTDKTGTSDGDAEDDDEDEEIGHKTKGHTPKSSRRKTPRSVANQKKRRRIVVPSDDESSDDEYKPKELDDSSDSMSSGVDENDVSEPSSESEAGTPQKSRKRKRGSSSTPATGRSKKVLKPSFKVMTPDPRGSPLAKRSPPEAPTTPATPKGSFLTPTISSKTKSKLSSFLAPEASPGPTAAVDCEEARYPHQRYDWLKDGHRKDRKGHPQGHPDYDPRTLYVPKSFLDKTTPAMRQWWEMKSQFFDTVLFFKMGKFYEFYHMDADIGVKELGLIYMKGENAHSGFPEIAYGRYSDTLIQKGYRVARVEQTETPDMMQERVRKLSRMVTKYDKVVKREICRISTKGTRTFSFIDGDTCVAQHNYLLAVKERASDEASGDRRAYGVCFVDTSIGKFHMGQFDDDRHCSRFRTLIAHCTPAQVVYERSKLSAKSQQILTNSLPSVIREPLVSGSEFWDAGRTLKTLAEGRYFDDDEAGKEGGAEPGGRGRMPAVLRDMISEADALGQSAKEGSELAVSALGACTCYLKKSCLEQELLSMGNIELYTPLDVEAKAKVEAETVDFAAGRQHMVLDGVTLFNLDILENGTSGTLEGSLLERLDHCCTPFGKRLFKQWLCAPLCNPNSINDRLDAVEDLINVPDKMAEVNDLLKKLPDLERLLSKIHTLGSARRNQDHPDSRAIFFEDNTYSKRKIQDFMTALGGFKMAVQILAIFKNSAADFKSTLLKQTVSPVSPDGQPQASGHFPDLTGHLAFFDNAFDHNKAKQAGAIVPSKGVDPEYDGAIAGMKSANQRLEDYLDRQRKRLGCRAVTYWGTGKNRFQLEVPESALARRTPEDYELQSAKKGFKRYWTAEITEMFAELCVQEERRDVALRDSMRRVFHAFDERYADWERAVQCLSVLDVLQSLSTVSQAGDGPMCRPEIVRPMPGMQPFLAIQNGRHPCISRTFTGGDFIPNDTYIGTKDDSAMEMDSENQSDDSCCVLVTGPNMGGKSTLMRQTGLIVVMAQLGCYVTAEGCRLTPVDRVFTRLGARDNILSGESTFFVELSETSSILQHATPHSLVLVDELGRGTATYDGTAIASAVVKELSETVRCRTLFSTHYHSLVEDFGHDRKIRLGHMACMVENESEEDPGQETITFLYKFAAGACPKSYGFNAAKLAGIPDEIVMVARRKAQDFERSADRLKAFRSLQRLSPGPDFIKCLRKAQGMVRS